jgi:hypothetical protein
MHTAEDAAWTVAPLPWQAPHSGSPGTAGQSDSEAVRLFSLDRRQWQEIMLNAPVNCLKEHEKEKLLSHSITTAMPFGSSFPGGYYATEPDRLWASHFSSPRPQIYAGNSK